MGKTVALVICTLLLAATCNAADNATNSTQNSRNAVLHADILFLGSQVLPLTTAKQNAIIVGVANVLGGGILASDINLTVLSTYNSIAATGGRKLLQTYPGADTRLDISTSKNLAGNQAVALSDASNKTYALASAIGAQGLQTQQIVLQSTDITQDAQTPPPASSPSPAATPEAAVGSPPPTPPTTPSPSPTPVAAGSASGNATSASTKSGSSSSLSGGAIAGIIVGAIALLALAVLAALWARRRSKLAQQEEVIEYFSGRDKQGPQAGNMIHATSSSQVPATEGALTAAAPAGAPAAPPALRTVPPTRLNIPNSAITNIDEKAEHGATTDKREVI